MDYDLIVVGSGPAGSATVLNLAKRAPSLARRTLILERDRHPRHKLCGGGLVVDVEHCLNRLGLDFRDVPHTAVTWSVLGYRNRSSKVRLTDVAFWVVRRHEFDAWLVDKARATGATLQEDTQVRSVKPIAGGVELETDRGTLRAKAVVGADGAKSVVRKAVAPASNSGVARLVEVYTAATSASFPSAACSATEASFDFSRVSDGIQGYVWSFPTLENGEPRRNWGVYDSRAVAGPMGGSLKTVLQETLHNYGYDLGDYKLEGAPLRWFEPTAPLATDHILLAGDAAGTDALYGEGISPAFGYGELAAHALSEAFDKGDFSFRSYGERVLKSPMGRSLLLRLRLARVIYRIRHPRFHQLLWWHGGWANNILLKHVVFNWARAAQAP